LERLGPVLSDLLDAAPSGGDIRADVSTKDLLTAVALLCHPAPDTDAEYSQRMVGLFIDGLRNTDPSVTGRSPVVTS
jgi:hypothetical protein